MSTSLMPKLGENQKSFAGIPEAVFVVSESSKIPNKENIT